MVRCVVVLFVMQYVLMWCELLCCGVAFVFVLCCFGVLCVAAFCVGCCVCVVLVGCVV